MQTNKHTVVIERTKRKVVTCAECRRAFTEKAMGAWTLRCKLSLPMEAKDCPEFKDARDASPRTP